MSLVAESTTSICPHCGRDIPGTYIERDKKIYLIKSCPECGSDEVCVALDATLFKRQRAGAAPKEASFEKLALAITSRCNLVCPMCYAPAKEASDPSLDELKAIIDTFQGSWIKVTGGEPTVREDLPELIAYLAERTCPFTLVTNGVRLADESYVATLKKVGLSRVALSFSGFSDDVYRVIRGEALFCRKMQALKNLKKHKIEVVLSTSLVRGVNDGEVARIYRMYLNNRRYIKALRFRTLSHVGRHMDVNTFSLAELVDLVAVATGFTKEELLGSYFEHPPYAHATCRLDLNLSSAFAYRMKRRSFLLRVITIGFEYVRFFGFQLPSKINGMTLFLRVWPDKRSLDLREMKKCLTGVSNGSEELVPFCLFNINQDINESNCSQ